MRHLSQEKYYKRASSHLTHSLRPKELGSKIHRAQTSSLVMMLHGGWCKEVIFPSNFFLLSLISIKEALWIFSEILSTVNNLTLSPSNVTFLLFLKINSDIKLVVRVTRLAFCSPWGVERRERVSGSSFYGRMAPQSGRGWTSMDRCWRHTVIFRCNWRQERIQKAGDLSHFIKYPTYCSL